MKDTMTQDEMRALIDAHLFLQSEDGDTARPNLEYCHPNTPSFVWDSNKWVWRQIDPDAIRKAVRLAQENDR